MSNSQPVGEGRADVVVCSLRKTPNEGLGGIVGLLCLGHRAPAIATGLRWFVETQKGTKARFYREHPVEPIGATEQRFQLPKDLLKRRALVPQCCDKHGPGCFFHQVQACQAFLQVSQVLFGAGKDGLRLDVPTLQDSHVGKQVQFLGRCHADPSHA